MTAAADRGKRISTALTTDSRVSVRSAGPEDSAIVSQGIFRGLASIGGDSFLAIELDGTGGDPKGRIRLLPLSALLAIDILEASPTVEEKRPDSSASPGYFR